LHKPFKYRLNDLAILSLVTFTVTIVFFSLSSNKLIHYVSPTLPFVAIMTGNFLGSVNSENWKSSKMNWSILFLIVLCVAIPLTAYFVLSKLDSFAISKNYAFIFLSLTIGAVVMLYFLMKRNLKGVVITMATSFIFMTNLVFYLLLPQLFNNNPIQASKHIIESAQGIGSFRHFNSAFVMESREPILNLSNTRELARFFEDYPDGVVITRDKYLEEFDLTSSYEVIFKKNDLIDKSFTILLKKPK